MQALDIHSLQVGRVIALSDKYTLDQLALAIATLDLTDEERAELRFQVGLEETENAHHFL